MCYLIAGVLSFITAGLPWSPKLHPDQNAGSVSIRPHCKSAVCDAVLMMNQLKNIHTQSSQTKPPKTKKRGDREHTSGLLTPDTFCTEYTREWTDVSRTQHTPLLSEGSPPGWQQDVKSHQQGHGGMGPGRNKTSLEKMHSRALLKLH